MKLWDEKVKGAPCPRCNGTGYLAHFSHVANGRCFLCTPPPPRDYDWNKLLPINPFHHKK